MNHRPLWPFSYNEDEFTPEVKIGSEGIRFVLRDLTYDGDRATFKVHLAFMLPTDLILRYHQPEEAIVLVVHDIDQRAGFAQRTRNDFIHVHYAEGEHPSPNAVSEPATPFPGRGAFDTDSYRGGYVAGALGFSCPRPVLKPSIFVYAVLENYVSNRFALDLIDSKVIDLG